jgi:hypothetical protein
MCGLQTRACLGCAKPPAYSVPRREKFLPSSNYLHPERDRGIAAFVSAAFSFGP